MAIDNERIKRISPEDWRKVGEDFKAIGEDIWEVIKKSPTEARKTRENSK